MLQFGGHHYGANIAYNAGHVVGGTPLFEAIEPVTFTTNGVTYFPLTQEREALATMLASLTAAQLTAAKLTQTFSDTTMSPGESNGGNGAFPTIKVGVPVSTLSAAQKLLVLEAVKPWVKDMDDTAAAATTTHIPTPLGGVQVAVRDSAGTAGSAPLFYVSPAQISFQTPTGTAAASATVTVARDGVTVGQGTATVESHPPGLFAANADGKGVAAIVVRVKADATQISEAVLRLNPATQKYESVAISLGDSTDQVYVLLFGTSFRNRSSLTAVSATIGSAATVYYTGAQGAFVGLDHANVLIPRSLAGRGEVM